MSSKLRVFSDGIFPEFQPFVHYPDLMHADPLQYTQRVRHLQHPRPDKHPRPGAMAYPWLYQQDLVSFETYPANDQWRTRLQKKSGERYDGTWEDGTAHGDGTMIFSCGNEYTGEFSEGKPHGQGLATNTKGDVYDGQWYQSLRQGHGVETFADGNRYDGEWVANARCGKGTMTYSDGSRYEGEWQADKMHGEGAFYMTGGETYQGQWRADLEDGFGVQTRPDGTTWTGPWSKGDRDGQGAVSFPDGTQYHSVWKHGREVACGVYTNERWETPLREVVGASILERTGRWEGPSKSPAHPQIRAATAQSRRHRSHDVWRVERYAWEADNMSVDARYGSANQYKDLLDYVPPSEFVETGVPQIALDNTSVGIKCDVFGTKRWG